MNYFELITKINQLNAPGFPKENILPEVQKLLNHLLVIPDDPIEYLILYSKLGKAFQSAGIFDQTIKQLWDAKIRTDTLVKHSSERLI